MQANSGTVLHRMNGRATPLVQSFQIVRTASKVLSDAPSSAALKSNSYLDAGTEL